MAYGMTIYNPDGYSVAYDSTSPGGVFVQFIVMPITASSTEPTIVNLNAAYIGKIITLYPLQSGDHTYSFTPGSSESGQVPNVMYWSKNSVADFNSRKQTILMVFAK